MVQLINRTRAQKGIVIIVLYMQNKQLVNGWFGYFKTYLEKNVN
jgi:hypothetical protein